MSHAFWQQVLVAAIPVVPSTIAATAVLIGSVRRKRNDEGGNPRRPS
jgi:hypothetical protein